MRIFSGVFTNWRISSVRHRDHRPAARHHRQGVWPQPPARSAGESVAREGPLRCNVMDQPKLNAVVTLRNEVSPWLMILQVAAEGWDLPDFVPAQVHLLRLVRFRLPMRVGRTRSPRARPGQAHPARILHCLISVGPRIHGILPKLGAGRSAHAASIQSENGKPRLALFQGYRDIYFRPSSRGCQRGPDRQRLWPCTLHKHAPVSYTHLTLPTICSV